MVSRAAWAVQIYIYMASNGAIAFLWLASHITMLKLQSEQISPWVVNWIKLFAQSHQTLYPHRGWGLGTRLLLMLPRALQIVRLCRL